MFIYSVKSTTLKFFGIVGVAILTLVALIFLVPSYSEATTKEIAAMNENISFDNVKSSEDVVEFLSQYGWTVDENIIEECEITIPKEFDKVMTVIFMCKGTVQPQIPYVCPDYRIVGEIHSCVYCLIHGVVCVQHKGWECIVKTS